MARKPSDPPPRDPSTGSFAGLGQAQQRLGGGGVHVAVRVELVQEGLLDFGDQRASGVCCSVAKSAAV